ncbi:winged helix-turn-helix domain-containing protein [Poseidonocella sedimentorum]|uniref:Molybdate transport system regulatory protein n=1 Tax=Poseidonocella sedimentorum TaxID=871652 RepID=A0A1I6D560_9RHOB|nr:winged helix-turn-helix domain-containing protein [Poseidonocella sedimentorum]SFR00550.1 molybdate transport system regulatory protein [Poseidonocella sedimentorum]
MAEPKTRLRLRLHFGEGAMLGPGKADLLEKITETGSISAAGRGMGMSYKRAWMLVETLNSIFAEPLVVSSRGGAQGGGAEVTEMGRQVLAQYRALEARVRAAGAAEISALEAMLASDMSDGK